MTPPQTHSPCIAWIKVVAAQIIVWHHLCTYGPLSDAAARWWPDLAALLYNKGRLAVQVFLVVAGFLAAQGLGRVQQWNASTCGRLAFKRFARLVWPLVAALVLVVVASALTRPVLPPAMLTAPPELWQLLAHLLLLQGVLGVEPMSAGIWYVAIDFQLFVLLLLFFAWPTWIKGWHLRAMHVTMALTVGLMLASLWALNRVTTLDNWAPYFFGSYGLGVCAWWASRSPQHWAWCVGLGAAVLIALAIDFRGRILLAGLTAGVLMVGGLSTQSAHDSRLAAWWQKTLHAAASCSYALFLVHFPVLLLTNGAWAWWVQQHGVQPDRMVTALVLLFTWCASWCVARLFHAAFEAAPRRARGKAQLLQ
jgi:peptidoglycan/LPS O-acetylase OafA/YrhL